MAKETLDDSLRLATTNTAIDIGTIVSDRPVVFQDLRFVVQNTF